MKQAVFLILAMTVSVVSWADVERGRQLHDEHCMKCHDDGVYTRDGRFVASKEALVKQVNRCAQNTDTGWSETDVNDVVEYLNATYYKFD